MEAYGRPGLHLFVCNKRNTTRSPEGLLHNAAHAWAFGEAAVRSAGWLKYHVAYRPLASPPHQEPLDARRVGEWTLRRAVPPPEDSLRATRLLL